MTKKFLSVLLALAIVITTTFATSSLAFGAIDNVDGDDDLPVSTNIDNVDGDDDDIASDIKGYENLVSAYDSETVTNDDKEKLESLKNSIVTYIQINGDSLTEEDSANLDKVLSDVQALLDKIDATNNAVDSATAAATAITTVDASNVEAAKNAVTAIDNVLASGNLTDAQKNELTAKKAELQQKIDDYNKSASTPSEPSTPTTPSEPSTPTTPSEPSTPAEPVQEVPVVSDVENSKDAFTLNAGLKVTNSGNSIGIKWGKVSKASGYEVYVQYCGKNFSSKPTKTIKSAKTTSCTIKKINGKAISKTKNFKIYVVAYQNVGGKKVVLGKTIVAHVVGAKNKTYSNVKSLSVSKKSYTLKKGKTATIKAKTTLVNPKKKQLSNSHAKQFRYKSTNKKVATVSSKGKIKAVGKGKCTVYVYARNGYAKAIKVTVK